jgi:ankyrin repeat protein
VKKIKKLLIISLLITTIIKAADLHFAAKNGYSDRVEKLLSNKKWYYRLPCFRKIIDVNSRDENNNTALHAAVLALSKYNPQSFLNYNNILKTIRVLLNSKADPNAKNDDDVTPLYITVLNHENNDSRIVALLLNSKANPNTKNKQNNTILCAATNNSGNGYEDIIRLLLNSKADPNAYDDRGFRETPLHNVLTCTTTHEFDHDRSIMIKLLLNSKANPDIQNLFGNTALHVLLKGHHQKEDPNYDKKTLKLLLENKANPDVRNEQGDTALHFAVRFNYPNLTLAQILLHYKANPDIKNQSNRTPLEECLTRVKTAQTHAHQFARMLPGFEEPK